MPDRSQAQPERSLGYLEESRRPLPILIFLLPLVVLYEFGSLLLLSGVASEDMPSHTIRAYYLLEQAIRIFGVGGVYLPGILVVLVLAAWHIAGRYSWRFSFATVLCMAAESIAWTVPLLVLSVIATDLLGLGQAAAAAQTTGGESDPAWRVWLLVAIGAGVYEELLFRLLLLSGIVWVLTKAGNLRRGLASAIGVGITAVLFALYHDLSTAGQGFAWDYIAYFTVLGVAFGALYLFRGFGIVVAAHALLDVVLLLWW